MKKLMFLLVFCALSLSGALAQKTFSGKVTSAEDGLGLPGVNVVVKGNTAIGTATDLDGKWTLTVPSGNSTLIFTAIGMKQIEIAAKDAASIVMQQDSQVLDEVMIVAYGTAKKSSFTGSASTVKSDQLEKRQVSNISDALTGVAAGVQASSESGQPGSGSKIRIRGMGSIAASSDPLYVVDGIPFDGDISSINGQDIETISVLKDAASSSLYGARGANGVILITTKRGKLNKTRVIFEAKYGMNERAVPEYDIMDSPSMYYEKYYEGIYNSEIAKGVAPKQANINANKQLLTKEGLNYNIYDIPAGEMLIGADGKLNPNGKLGRLWENEYYLTNDNWYDELFGSSSSRQEYNISVSGGDEKTNVYFSTNYLDDEGIIVNSKFKRLTSRLKASYQVKEWFKLSGNMSYTSSINDYPGSQKGLSSLNLFYASRIVAPIYPMYVRDKDGNIKKDARGITLYDYGTGEYPELIRPVMSISNPGSDLSLNKRQYKSNIFSVRASSDFDILKDNLKLVLNLGYDADNTRYLNKGNAYYGQAAAKGGDIFKYNQNTEALSLQQLLTYKNNYKEHSFEVLLGHETYDRKWDRFSGSKKTLYDPDSEEISNAINDPEVYSYSNSYFIEGYLSRLNYDFRDKYFFSASYRRDGSSRFSKDNRWGNFWSLGASWLMHKEAFLEDASWLNLLKLKLSYGAQGNDALQRWEDGEYVQNYYPYQDQYEIKNSNNSYAVELFYKGNRDITWETSYNFNAGVEFGLFDNRIEGSLEFFNRKVEDMLFYRPVPNSAGYTSYPDNIGSMRNRGVELSLSGVILNKEDIRWTASINGTHYKNEILTLPEEFNDPIGHVVRSRVWKVGGSIYDMFYPLYTGVNEKGEPTWQAKGKDGKLGVTNNYSEASKKENKHNFGTTLPDLQGGFSTSLMVHGVDLSIALTYQLGGQVYDYAYASLMHGGTARNAGSNWHKDILDSWTSSNKNSNIPMINYAGKDINSASDRFITSASYLSLNNITLGYTFPKSISEKLRVSSLRIFGVVDNVALFTKRKGLDPRQSYDGTTGFIYSPIRTISAGLKVEF